MATGPKPAQIHLNLTPDLLASFRFATSVRGETMTGALLGMVQTYVGSVPRAEMIAAIDAEQSRLDSMRDRFCSVSPPAEEKRPRRGKRTPK